MRARSDACNGEAALGLFVPREENGPLRHDAWARHFLGELLGEFWVGSFQWPGKRRQDAGGQLLESLLQHWVFLSLVQPQSSTILSPFCSFQTIVMDMDEDDDIYVPEEAKAEDVEEKKLPVKADDLEEGEEEDEGGAMDEDSDEDSVRPAIQQSCRPFLANILQDIDIITERKDGTKAAPPSCVSSQKDQASRVGTRSRVYCLRNRADNQNTATSEISRKEQPAAMRRRRQHRR